MLRLAVVCVLLCSTAACRVSNTGCDSDTQCREGRTCVDARCQWTDALPTPDPIDDDGCESDDDCPADTLCREGACDEFQCRNEDGTDTSPDCECARFEFKELDGGGCSYEQRCFSGNLLLECAVSADGVAACTCYESLRPISSVMADFAQLCAEALPDPRVNEICGWTLP